MFRFDDDDDDEWLKDVENSLFFPHHLLVHGVDRREGELAQRDLEGHVHCCD